MGRPKPADLPQMNEDTNAVVTVMINDEWWYLECTLAVEKCRGKGGLNRLTQQIYWLKREHKDWLKSQAGDWPDMRKVSARRIAEYFWYEEG